jgi:hypothetical protein
MKLTEDEKRHLVCGEMTPINGKEYVGIMYLGMDSHECEVSLVVFRHEGNLYGFICRYGGEMYHWEDDPDEAVPVTPKEIVVTKYDRSDGEKWEWR